MATITTVDDLRAVGMLDGYESALTRRQLRNVIGIDAEIATRADCSACNHHGLDFRPYYRIRDGRHDYFVVLVCPACGQADLL